MYSDLRSFLAELRRRKDLIEIEASVDPKLEIAEIHRRIISEGGRALLFKNPAGSPFPVVTNLFGTKDRVDLAFGSRPEKFVASAAALPHKLVPPTLGKLWGERSLIGQALKIGISHAASAPVCENQVRPPDLDQLPLLTTWKEDGGPFITLPLVYTEDPETKIHNLGMYRMQRFSKDTLGLHMQIGKGGGYHLFRAREKNQHLPVNISLGGPPALILSAVAPLPENVGELMFASLVLGKRLRLAKNPAGPLPLVADAEFSIVGSVKPDEMHPEGPFGDHYGYYSLKHDYPLFRCDAVLHRNDAIFPATVVGKPRQEDYYIGNYLQEMLAPLFPVVMPAVRSLWSYGETGYHSLAAAVVRESFRREAMISAFRILGEGQLALTKFLLVTDRNVELKNFKSVLETILERFDPRSDLFVFSNLSMDTLDYTGPKVNEGSKGVLLGVGDPIRELPAEFTGSLPRGIQSANAFCRGCLVVDGGSHELAPNLPNAISSHGEFTKWPLIILVDDVKKACANEQSFLWTVFTRFEPAADISSRHTQTNRFHVSLQCPIVIDARMKGTYPAELECDDETKKKVDTRWREYFPA